MNSSQRFSIGSIDCETVTDGTNQYDIELVFAGVPAEALPDFGADELDEQGRLIVPYNPLLVRVAGKLVLIDAGLGDSAGELGSSAGRLQESLRRTGVRPEEIDIVIVTHAHPDHIGGLTQSSGTARRLVFSAARHVFWRSEWEFWTSADTLAALPDVLAGPARVHLPVLRASGQLELVDREADILPGLRLVSAPGHTPGHVCVALSSEGQQAIFAADVVAHESNFEHPQWMTAFESDPAMALTTRGRVYAQAADSGSLFIAFHLAAAGRVERAGDGYRFQHQEVSVTRR